MTIHLPDDLETFVQAAVQEGRFTSVDEAMIEAARLLVRELKRNPWHNPAVAASPADPGSIGFMSDSAEELDAMVDDAMSHRHNETWREFPVE